MLETPSKQKFFTLRSNYKDIIGFVNDFNCELSVVELEKGQILNLTDLAKAIAAGRPSKHAKFNVLEIKRQKRRRAK